MRIGIYTERIGLDEMQYTKKIAFFFLFFLVLPLIFSDIIIEPDVLFSFGCEPDEPLTQNCTSGGNYLFKTILLNNETPPYSFSDIKLYRNYSVWDNNVICRNIPFFQPVWTYSDIYNWICCESYWVANYTPCTIGDNHTLIYYDANRCLFPTNIPVDNGTISYCNYCSEDLQVIYGECLDNSTQSVTWVDLNQFICCDVTNLPSDCSIRTYPYNETTYQFCKSKNAFIGTPNCRKNPKISDRIREDCIIEIPDEYKNEDYKCFSIVKEKDTGKIVQVNPDRNRTYPVLESRDYFKPLYNTINFYYTGQNLRPDRDYIVRLECSSSERFIYSEYEIKRDYEDISWIFYRIKWLKENTHYIVMGIIVLIILLLIFLLIVNLIT